MFPLSVVSLPGFSQSSQAGLRWAFTSVFPTRWLVMFEIGISVVFFWLKNKNEIPSREGWGLFWTSAYLGGGLKYFLFSPLFGEDSHFD